MNHGTNLDMLSSVFFVFRFYWSLIFCKMLLILVTTFLIIRISTISMENNGHFQPQGSVSSEDGKIPSRRDSVSPDAMANCGIVGGDELDNGLQTLTATTGRGYVNNNDTPTINTEDEETVHTRTNTEREEGQLRPVNNRDGSNMKNLFAEGDEFD